MKETRTVALTLIVVLLVGAAAHAQASITSVCTYAPPESRTADLSLQGSFNWYDGPYKDDRNQSMTGNLQADFSQLTTSVSSASQLDALAEVTGSTLGWGLAASGTGSLSTFFHDDLFGIGAISWDADTETGLEVDLTGGVGNGRFKDVTPMARAIRIQNALLDIGQLLAPLSSDGLAQLAKVVGEIGPTRDERLASISSLLQSTQLVPGDDLNIRGLLSIEEVLEASDATRLCGSDVQARLGAAATLAPSFSLSATGILLGRYAAVPDPVSQWESSVEAKFRLPSFEQMNVKALAAYARQLPDGWTARAQYRLQLDRRWTDTSAIVLTHDLSTSLTTKLFGSIGVSVVGILRYQTGDEEITTSLALHVEADLL